MRHTSLALLAALALAACDNPAGDDAVVSLVRLTYTGPVSGTFEANGDPNPLLPYGSQQMALGLRDPGTGELQVHAVVSRTDGYDLAVLALPSPAVGTMTIGPCTEAACPGLTLLLGIDSGFSEGSGIVCVVDAGTIEVQTYTPQHAAGTVQGTGTCSASAGSEPFAVTDGRFDVRVDRLPGSAG